MPKTTKPFDWEVYDENDEFIDILTMTRFVYELECPYYLRKCLKRR